MLLMHLLDFLLFPPNFFSNYNGLLLLNKMTFCLVLSERPIKMCQNLPQGPLKIFFNLFFHEFQGFNCSGPPFLLCWFHLFCLPYSIYLPHLIFYSLSLLRVYGLFLLLNRQVSWGCGLWVCVSPGLVRGQGWRVAGPWQLMASHRGLSCLVQGSCGSWLGMMSERIIWFSVTFLKELPFACFYGTIFWDYFLFNAIDIIIFSLFCLMGFISLRFWTWPENEELVERRWARHHQMCWGSRWGHGEDSR